MIGTKARWMTGALVSAGLFLGSVTAAEARPRYGYDRGWDRHGGWDRHHHRRGNGFGLGDAIGVAAIVGAVAIVASSLNKDKQAQAGRSDDLDAPSPASGTGYGANVRTDTSARDDADFSDIAAQDEGMTDACAIAARDEAQNRNGGYAEVRQIDAPRATPDGSYNIDGEVEVHASYRAATGTIHRFTCAMKNGRVATVYLSRDVAMQ
ncbi:hypothetical protein Q4610_11570 [Sphingobium sp. HBC34]|uniref:Secreted protein n=1 Tax=Sphingobium cyanobacteriorum TaxID=3063954 RepID=A0ABT8ZMI4_9SPHN|nr:hypothetical protein [Sphingobium sp. HBC34]MDO7835681.1 hypothetical protein [Sphingobium sp. HBC34]